MALLCFIFIFINMGTLNSLGVFMPSLVKETGYTTAQISLMFTFAGVGAALTGMTITPHALKKIGEKNCMLCTVMLTACHLLIYSFTSQLAVLYLGALIAGIAIGIGLYAACSAIIGNWFIKNRLTVLSIISAGSGTGSAFINMFSGQSIVAIGYRSTYRILAIMVIAVGLVIYFLIKNKPEDIGQNALQDDVMAEMQGDKAEADGITIKEALKGPSFYMLFAAAVLGSVAWTGINMYLITLISSNYGMPVNVATRYDALLRICVVVFLLVGGRIVEKIGIRAYVLFVGICMSVGITIIVLTGSSLIGIPVLLAAVMIMISVGGSHGNANNQMLANNVFGRKDFRTIQAYLVSGGNTGIALSAILARPWIGDDGSTLGCFKLFLICTLVWLILVLMAIRMTPYKKNIK